MLTDKEWLLVDQAQQIIDKIPPELEVRQGLQKSLNSAIAQEPGKPAIHTVHTTVRNTAKDLEAKQAKKKSKDSLEALLSPN